MSISNTLKGNIFRRTYKTIYVNGKYRYQKTITRMSSTQIKELYNSSKLNEFSSQDILQGVLQKLQIGKTKTPEH